MKNIALAPLRWRLLVASALCFMLIINSALVAAFMPQTLRIPARAKTNMRAPDVVPERLGEAARARIKDAFGKLPLRFEENRGQADSGIKFLSRGPGYSLFLTDTEAVMSLTKTQPGQKTTSRAIVASDFDSEMVRAMPPLLRRERASFTRPDLKSKEPGTQSAVLRMRLANANPAPRVTGRGELADTASYYIGSDPKNWASRARSFEKVEYREVYPGIDLIYYGNQGQLEYDFNLAPGADHRAITLRFRGADDVKIDQEGELVIQVGDDEIRQHRPVIYQEFLGVRKPVSGRYLLKGDSRVGFQVDDYDPTLALVIDPVVSFGTYLGGSETDSMFGLGADAAGNVYTAGFTTSLDYPTASPLQPGFGGGPTDVVVSKLSADLSQLIYSTYIGGSGDDRAMGLDVDQAGNVYVTGFTSSPNFPPINAMQEQFGGIRDIFALKLDGAGSIVYSTYIGRNGDDRGQALAVDSAGNVAIVGLTNSTTFPMVNAFQATYGGSPADVFVLKLNVAGSALLYSSYLGGSASAQPVFGELVNGIHVDSAGNIYLTGFTESSNFPTKSAVQTRFGGGTRDAFLAKVDSTKTGADSLVYSTYLGGSNRDEANAVTVDTSGNAYVTGFTFSTNFPTANADQTMLAGGADTFVSQVNADGRSLGFSTYLGGTNNEQGTDVEVDQQRGKLFVAGGTTSSNFAVPFGSNGTISAAAGEAEPCCGFGYGKADPVLELLWEWFSSNGGLSDTNVNAIDGEGDRLIVGHDAGADISTDGGKYWRPMFTSPAPIRDVEYKTSAQYFISSDDSIFRSQDSGDTWQNYSDGLPGGRVIKDIGSFFFSNYALTDDGDLYLDPTGRWEKVDTPGGAKVKQIVADASGERGWATLVTQSGGNEVRRWCPPTFCGAVLPETDEISRMGTGHENQSYFGYLLDSGILGTHDIKYTTDDGATFTRLDLNIPAGTTFSDFCIEDDGDVLVGTNRGTLSFNIRAGARYEFTAPYEVLVTDVISIPGGSYGITTRFGESPYVSEYTFGAGRRLSRKGVYCLAADGNSSISRIYDGFYDDVSTSPRLGFSWSTSALKLGGNYLSSDGGGFGNYITAAAPFQANNRGGLDSVIVVLDFSPRITNVTRSGKKLIVDGDDFDEGAKILVNGKQQKKTSNDATSPATKLISKKAGKKIRAGDIVQVENLDGARSNEFRYP